MNKEEFEKMKGSKMPSETYVVVGAIICGLIIWATLTDGPDGFMWFFVGAFTMGIIMNLSRDKEIDKLSK